MNCSQMPATQSAEVQTAWKVKSNIRSSGLTSALGPSGSLQQAISFFTGMLPFTIWTTISRPRPRLAPVISTFIERAAISSASSCCSLWGSKECLDSFSHTHVLISQPGFGPPFFFLIHLCFESIFVLRCSGHGLIGLMPWRQSSNGKHHLQEQFFIC